MPVKDNDVSYLKLQWIACQDENEKKRLAEKIKQVLSQN
jgi:hypothetical protein